MDGDEDEGPDGPNSKKVAKAVKRHIDTQQQQHEQESSNFAPFLKPNYIRQYPEHSTNTEFKVYVESQDKKERFGNKSPIYLNHIFTTEIKGVVALQRVNASKIVVIFKLANTANNFIANSEFLAKYNLKAYIPAAQIEKTGVIRFVPINISNRELYSKLSSHFEIIAVRRFMKKVGQQRVPLQTVSLTFLSNNLPENVQYDLFSYRVFDYVPPLQQCYRCFKFNHSARVCNGKQRCSCCAGEHLYTECDKPTELCCANCRGAHLAVSRSCPIKIQKMLEKQKKITYASVVDTKTYEQTFPTISENVNKTKKAVNNNLITPVNKTVQKVNKAVHKVNDSSSSSNINKLPVVSTTQAPEINLKEQLLNNSDLNSAIIRTILEISNKGDGTPINSKTINDMLHKYLS